MVASTDTKLKAILAEMVKSRCLQEESLKTLRSIDERMKRNNDLLVTLFKRTFRGEHP